jgi:thiol-disulfide isomerase/thioredoxin
MFKILVSLLIFMMMTSTAFANLSVFEIAKDAADTKKRTLKEVINRNPSMPIMVMFWGINCKPCVEESKFISTVAAHFKKKLDFIALQIEDDIDPRAISSATAFERFNKMTQVLAPFGVKKDKIPKSFVVANEISVAWQAVLDLDPSFKDTAERSSIPLFALFDQDRKIVKIWTASIIDDFTVLDDFLEQIQKVTK